MYYFEKQIEEELEKVRFLISKNSKQLKKLKAGFLSVKHHKKGDAYYEVDNHGRQIGGLMRGDAPRVMEIQKQRYLSLQQKILKNNESRLNRIRKVYSDYSPDTINGLLPRAYRLALNKENRSASSRNRRLSDLIPSIPMPKSHFAADGTQVRSLGEVIIYNLLLYYDVQFEYEKAVHIRVDGELHTFYPDFIITVGRKKYYWEHVGMFDREDYRLRFHNKIELLYKCDIVLGSNLIVTFSKADGSIDSEEIDRTIRGWLT